MADKNIGALPAAAALDDDSLLIAEQQGEAVHFSGALLKNYAKEGVADLVAEAQSAATRAEEAAASVEDVAADAQAAKNAAAEAAASQVAAARSAQNAATSQNAASSSASTAKTQADRATSAAQNAATNAAQQAANQTSSALRAEVQSLVNNAERAASTAQSAAENAAEDAVAAVGSDMAGYVSAAQAAQAAAEKARDEAQTAVGGNFMDKNVYDPQGKSTDVFKYVDDAVGNMELPDDVGDMTSAVYDPQGKKTDIYDFATAEAEFVYDSLSGIIRNTEQRLMQEIGALGDSVYNSHVPNSRTVNGKALSSDIALTASDVGAATDDHTHSNYVPTARTVNGKALSGNITLSASDVGAAEANHTHDDLGGSTFYEATIGTNWTEDENTGVKSQTVSITGVTDADNAHVEPRYTGDGTSDGYAAFVEQKNQFFTCITNGYAETVSGGIAFHIFGDAPTVSIPVLVEVK